MNLSLVQLSSFQASSRGLTPPFPLPAVLPFYLSSPLLRSWGLCVCLPHMPGTSSSWWKSLNRPLPRLLRWHQYCPVLNLGPLMLHGGGGLRHLLGTKTLQITFLTTTPHSVGPDKAGLRLTPLLRRPLGPHRGGTMAECPFSLPFLCSRVMEIASSDSGP